MPISRLAECFALIKADIAETDLLAPLVGHVGDGNFHLVLLFDSDDPRETAIARRIRQRLVETALSMGGTSTGGHGIGLGKKSYMAAEHGPALDLMKRLKLAVDPKGIMNPGKLLDM